MNEINLGKGRMELMLKQLEVEGALNKVRGGWERSRREWIYDEERITAVTAARRAEQKAMELYGSDGRCLMESLRIELDDPGAEPCGRCSICTEPKFDGELDRNLSLQAIDMLRARPIEIEPRKSTPTAVGGFKKILRPELIEPGRALSLLNDAAWGRLVVQGKFKDEHFADELVEAAAALIKNWGPKPAPEWVTAVPSLRHPGAGPRLRRAAGQGDRPALQPGRRRRQEGPGAEQARELPPAVPERAGGVRGRPRGVPAGAGPADRRHRRLEVDDDRGGAAAAEERGCGCGAVCAGELGWRRADTRSTKNRRSTEVAEIQPGA